MNLGELELKFLDGIKNVPSAKEKAFITLNPIEMIKTLTAKYGKDWIIWDNVETLYKNIESDFVPGYSRNEVYWMHKDFINALKVMCRSDDFWIDWMVFEKCCKGVSQEVVDFGTIQSCSPGQCLLGMKVAEFIRNEEFDPEVKSYIAACCKSRGLVYLPESLSIAGPAFKAFAEFPPAKTGTVEINSASQIAGIVPREKNFIFYPDFKKRASSTGSMVGGRPDFFDSFATDLEMS